MKNFTKLFWIITVLLLLPLTASAAPVGKITHIEGNVDITAGDTVRPAGLGEPVNAGDVLRSKSRARAEVTFLDGNILRLAEGTRVRITDYPSGEGKTTILNLFRGKTQNIVSSLAKNARYEVHTPTSVCGVRGTNFFSFFHDGVSGFVPKEGTIYGYNRNMPQDVKTVTPGQALLIPGNNQPPVIQPATSIEVDKHVSDTAPVGDKGDKDKKDAGASAAPEVPMILVLTPTEPTQASGGLLTAPVIGPGPGEPPTPPPPPTPPVIPPELTGTGVTPVEEPPLTTIGYWGYDMSTNGEACLFMNNNGYEEHVADEWGLIGARSAPWSAPAVIKAAGEFRMDSSGSDNGASAPGFLLGSPIGSRPKPADMPWNDSVFADGDFFGGAAGIIGPYTGTSGTVWSRSAKGGAVALYLKDGKAGWLTTYAPGSAVGGLTGGFSLGPDGGTWHLDGILKATPMETRTTLSDFMLQERELGIIAAYGNASGSRIRGEGGFGAAFFNAYDSMLEGHHDLPWGIFGFSIGNDSAASFEGTPTALNGKAIKIAGGSTEDGFLAGKVNNPVWTSTASGNGEITGTLSGDYINNDQFGAFSGLFYGLYNEGAGGYGGGWIGEGVGTFSGQTLAFSSTIQGLTYVGSGSIFDTFSGIMGGLSQDIFTTGTSPIRFLGIDPPAVILDSALGMASLSTAEITSHIPVTSSFAGSYQGLLRMATDSAKAVSGEVLALYQQGNGGDGGILWSDDVAGTYDTEIGSWKAEGNLNAYRMPGDLSSSIHRWEYSQSYAAGEVPVKAISGGTVDLRTSQTVVLNFHDETSWGIWQNVSGGTYEGDTPRNWLSIENNVPLLTQEWDSSYGIQYQLYNMAAPVNGVSSGTVVGVRSVWNQLMPSESTPESFTLVMGGSVEALFDPNSTPLAWTAISQGGGMRSETFLGMLSEMTDSGRADFERALKIPAFDVGMANLRGNNGNLYVGMDNIKFFRFQNEANPQLWATNNVYGSYTTDPTVGTTVTLTSSGNLVGLNHTFEVEQWDTPNNGWGASIYNNGATDTGGILTRTETRTLPEGATATIPISAMTGLAAGSITPGVNNTGLPGTGSFSGTAAGVVEISTEAPRINVYFPYSYPATPGESTAAGRLLENLNSTTNIGSITLTLEYDQTPGQETPYLAPQQEIGTLVGRMQNGSNVTGLITSIPGSWEGALSGLYADATGVGLFLGYLDGTYNDANGRLTASGGLTRTPALTTATTGLTGVSPALFEQMGLDVPGVSAVLVGGPGLPAYIWSGVVSAGSILDGAGASQNYLSSDGSKFLSAWAVNRINDDNGFYYSAAGNAPTTWAAKYGHAGYNYAVQEGDDPYPYFIVGNVTGYNTGVGTETDPTRLRLSGRNLLYITPGYNQFKGTGNFEAGLPGSMGYINFESWESDPYYGGNSGGAGTIELAPTAFGGYWGYAINNCLYINDNGYEEHVGDEWGLIGAWTAPWNAPAAIKVAGAYGMDYADYFESSAPNALLLSSPVGSRPDPANSLWNEPLFQDGDFFGAVAGRLLSHVDPENGVWERTANGALAAIYVKNGKAGLLSTFTPGGSEGGLTGGFYPYPVENGIEYGYWSLDGTLTATPMETRTTLSAFTLQETEYDIRAGYGNDSGSLIRGLGGIDAFYFSAYDSEREATFNLPWGVFAFWIEDGYQDHGSGTGSSHPFDGKAIKTGGGSTESGFWIGKVNSPVWTSIGEGNGEITGVTSGDYMTMDQIGTFSGPFYGLYNEESDGDGGFSGGWIGEGVGTFSGQMLAFSSAIDGSTFKTVVSGYGESVNLQQDQYYFSGIMGGLSLNLFASGTSPIKFLGLLGNKEVGSLPTVPFVAASAIFSHIPVTSTFTGYYEGFAGVAADSANVVSGGIMALYQQGYGYGGILYSDDIAGTYAPEIGSWKAQGDINAYQMSGYLSSSTINTLAYTNNSQTSQTTIQHFPGESWGIWHRVFGGFDDTSAGGYGTGSLGGYPSLIGGDPLDFRSNISSVEENIPLPSPWAGGYGSEYLNFSMGASANGVSSGTVAGAEARWGEKMTAESIPESYTVVMGGGVKGIFDPTTTPLTWTAISQGGYMRTENFIDKQSGMADSERANFERATKIPAFDVGMANLRGNNGNLYVNMDNIKFFRFQNEEGPRIWATNNVYGSYAADPSVGTTVTLSSSGNLTGLTQTFVVKQWDTTNNGWGAALHNLQTDTPGTLARSTTDTARLPAAPTAIHISSMPGAAAGTITPGVNNTAAHGQSLPGTGSFSGTAAGVVVKGE